MREMLITGHLHIILYLRFIPKFMIPEVLVNVEAMPLTKNGKIDRKALMEEYNA